MISKEYIQAYKNFITKEINLTRTYKGDEYANRIAPYYLKMYQHISNNHLDYTVSKKSPVTYFEMEFAESVEPIRNVLLNLAKQSNIPTETLFVPRVKINNDLWDSIIHNDVSTLIRNLFDQTEGEDFETLRLYRAFERYSPIVKWTKSKNGKNFLYEFQVTQGIRSEFLIKKRLYLFDNEFVRQQMMWMSEQIWIHQEIISAFNKWEQDKKLWNKIDHIKRKINKKELLDESRPEIKFLRLLENIGLKRHFIHDEQISWQLKYRPDFWFTKENLIVEYDEIAHKFQVENDLTREKIIRKHLPNVHFIRVKEGYESKGLKEIQEYLKKFSNE